MAADIAPAGALVRDPITEAVIQAGLVAAADEMFSVLKKTAMSPIIYEVLDVGTGITNAEGELVSSGAGIPGFVGVLDKAVKRIVKTHGAAIGEGDVFVVNDPNFGGVTHLNDVVIAMPVYHDGTRIAWTTSIAHWNDVGGMTPGSMPVNAREIWQEGLRLPAVKLFDRGEKLDAVFDIIRVNSRLPDFVEGDLWAQISASRVAGERIAELGRRYGVAAIEAAIAAAFEEGEQRTLAALKTLPAGRYEIAVEQDEGDTWHAAVEIAPDRFVVDLSQAPAERAGPFNTSRDGATISCQIILKILTDPSLFANGGTFRPLKVITRPGSIFDASDTAPHGYYSETRMRLTDMLWRGLAEAIPDRLPAGHFASICGTVIAGRHPDTGRRYTMVEPQMGGWGAAANHDGLHAMYSCHHGDTFNCPVEICEARYGIDVGWRSLSPSEAGAGRFSGGKGLSTAYRPRAEALLAVGYSHVRVPVWGADGGADGGRNTVAVHRPGGAVETMAFASNVRLGPGDELRIETANGGGWGKKA